MLPLIIGGLVILGFVAIWFGFVPPPHASTLIRIREGALHVQRGRVQSLAREHVSEILREAGVASGYIALTPGNRVVFSRQIPAEIHQQLRNVLLNQWA